MPKRAKTKFLVFCASTHHLSGILDDIVIATRMQTAFSNDDLMVSTIGIYKGKRESVTFLLDTKLGD